MAVSTRRPIRTVTWVFDTMPCSGAKSFYVMSMSSWANKGIEWFEIFMRQFRWSVSRVSES